jgi:hypothetical protein
MSMLNPTTYSNAALDYLSGGQDAEYSARSTSGIYSPLGKAERKFNNLMRQLNGEAPIPDPVATTGQNATTATPDRLQQELISALNGNGPASGNDANVKATEKQTDKLVDALKTYGSPRVSIITEFGP